MTNTAHTGVLPVIEIFRWIPLHPNAKKIINTAEKALAVAAAKILLGRSAKPNNSVEFTHHTVVAISHNGR
jgi:hypothetical protein